MITPEALSALRDRLIAATGPDRELDAHLLCLATGESFDALVRDGYVVRDLNPDIYTASTDSALGLVTRLLPGFDYILEHTNGGLTISCLLGTLDPDKRQFGATLPLAILLALVSALSQPGAQS